MPEPVIYIRGTPGLLDSDRVSPSASVLRDLRAVASLSDEQITAIRQRLSEVPGFLDPKTLATTVETIVAEQETVRAIQRVLRNVAPDDVEGFIKFLEKPTEGGGLEEPVLKRLRSILPVLVQPYPALLLSLIHI